VINKKDVRYDPLREMVMSVDNVTAPERISRENNSVCLLAVDRINKKALKRA
jgi:hypothetical protein